MHLIDTINIANKQINWRAEFPRTNLNSTSLAWSGDPQAMPPAAKSLGL